MEFTIRSYRDTDLRAVRAIYGDDEFARPRWLQKHPRMREYLADEVSTYYTHYEPESVFVAEVGGNIVGALLGATSTFRQQECYQRYIKPYLTKRFFSGAYGGPAGFIPMLRTEFAGRTLKPPRVDHQQYPAHLHIGILPAFRRQGIGAELMKRYAHYLRQKNVPGYHLFVSSFHPLGLAFYRKLGLDYLGQFNWRFHDGDDWLNVTETIFGRRLEDGRQ